MRATLSVAMSCGPEPRRGGRPHTGRKKSKKLFVIDDRCLIIRKTLEDQPRGVQRTKRL